MQVSFMARDYDKDLIEAHYQKTHRPGYRYEQGSVSLRDLKDDQFCLKYGIARRKTNLTDQELKNFSLEGTLKHTVAKFVPIEREIPLEVAPIAAKTKGLAKIYFKKITNAIMAHLKK